MSSYWVIIAEILMVTLLASLVTGGIYVKRLQKTIKAQGQNLDSLERDIQAICLGAKGMGDTVVRLERKLRETTERQDQLDLREPDTRPYHQAITLVHKGAKVDELVSTCGLARNEAELVHLLHRAEKSGGLVQHTLLRRT